MAWLYASYILLAIVTAAIVAAEMATYSTRRERLIHLSQEGNRSARMALIFLRAPRWYLAGSQLAATITTTLMGLLSSTLFSTPLQIWFEEQGLAPRTAQNVGFWSATLFLTILLTIFVNLLPKRFAFGYADEVAVASARSAWIWIKLTRPLLAALNWIVDKIASAFHIRSTGGTEITEQDVITLLREGRKDRLIDQDEYRIVLNALALSDSLVQEIMVPRLKMVGVELTRSVHPQMLEALKSDHSLIPAFEGGLDKPVGFVRLRDFSRLTSISEQDVRCQIRPLMVLAPKTTLLDALRHMKSADVRLAFVGNEHGETMGIVTLNDVMIKILGEA